MTSSNNPTPRKVTTESAAKVIPGEGTSLGLAAGASVVKNPKPTRSRITPEQIQAYKISLLTEELEFQKRRLGRANANANAKANTDTSAGTTTVTATAASTHIEEEGPPCREIVVSRRTKSASKGTATHAHKQQKQQKQQKGKQQQGDELPKNSIRQASSKSSSPKITSTKQQDDDDNILLQLHLHPHQEQNDHCKLRDAKLQQRRAKELGLLRRDGTLDLGHDDIQERRLITTPEGEVVEVIRVKRNSRKKEPTDMTMDMEHVTTGGRQSRHFSSGVLGQVRNYFSSQSASTKNSKRNLHVIHLRKDNSNGVSTTMPESMPCAMNSDHHGNVQEDKDPNEPATGQHQQGQDGSNSRRGSF
jgi:hypothetical protein